MGFRRKLDIFRGYITSAKDTIDNIQRINDKSEGFSDIVSTQIAFSMAGLLYLRVSENIGDPHFDEGPMRKDKFILGDRSDWDPIFEKANKNNAGMHGVIMVTTKGDSSNHHLRFQVWTDNCYHKVEDTCKSRAGSYIEVFRGSIDSPTVMNGRVREGETEFFGFRDGISQPALR